jgi:hypothetical protein
MSPPLPLVKNCKYGWAQYRAMLKLQLGRGAFDSGHRFAFGGIADGIHVRQSLIEPMESLRRLSSFHLRCLMAA